MNETLRVIAERYSCRAFEGSLPEKEKLDAIALAAVQSPSGMNRQPWQIVVITDKAFIEEMDKDAMQILSEHEDKSMYERFMGRGGTMFYNAPCIFLILMQSNTGLDCGIVSENIALAASALGLGNCICGMLRIPLNGARGEEFKQKIGFPEGWEFGMSVLVGYAGKPGTPHEPDMSKIRYI
ncbi:MAG: nitroreductase family protein [Defluviitaleaceae bacterium]|nr:nitroreductase family protein [Defluviitaleaceae bacterium]MCL2837055.1 nitroreductase family protein [Defluviitaleaceae bacterium]